ncbi:hypothetical protein D9M73_132690 [compost metagenome]
MHPDRTVSTIVDDEDEHVCAVRHRRREFLPVHQEAPVARERDDGTIRMAQSGGGGGGDAIAHCACGGGELAVPLIAPVTVPPAAVIASAVADDAVGGELLAHFGDAGAEIEFYALTGGGGRPGEIVGMGFPRVRARLGRLFCTDQIVGDRPHT